MIHVAPQPEPASFDKDVRQKGLAWLKERGISLEQPLPAGVKIRDYWRACLGDLYSSYEGYCAYLAVSFERIIGGATVDHFIAKSRRVDLAYEWTNYRLACSRMNSRKRDYDDVLDPFETKTSWFRLEMVTGHIYPNKSLPIHERDAVQSTINRLGLDDAGNRDLRAHHYGDYRNGDYSADYLKRQSPFVWSEAKRQGLL